LANDLYLDTLSLNDIQIIRAEKNKIYGAWRTPYLLTEKMQEDFYNKIINNRNSNDKYWGIKLNEKTNVPNNIHAQKESILIGMGGINHIQWENRLGEITLFITKPKSGYGTKAVLLILDKAFNELNLKNVYGECYECNPNKIFWQKIIERSKCYETALPNRKFYNGIYYDSIYFNFTKNDYDELKKYMLSKGSK